MPMINPPTTHMRRVSVLTRSFLRSSSLSSKWSLVTKLSVISSKTSTCALAAFAVTPASLSVFTALRVLNAVVAIKNILLAIKSRPFADSFQEPRKWSNINHVAAMLIIVRMVNRSLIAALANPIRILTSSMRAPIDLGQPGRSASLSSSSNISKFLGCSFLFKHRPFWSIN